MRFFMLNFDEYARELQNSTNFGSNDNFDDQWFIIKETLKPNKHNMLIGEGYPDLTAVYDQLADLEIADLYDFKAFEKLWTIT